MRKHRGKVRQATQGRSLMDRMLGRATALPRNHAITVGVAYHLALERIWRGQGDDTNMNQLAYSLNVAMALCELGVEANDSACIEAAQDALVRANWISRKEGRWTMSDESYRSICAALAVHDRQVEMATRGELLAAEKIIKDRLAAGQVIHVEAIGNH